MTTLDKTLLLENVLTQHKEKERKNYIAWNVLRTKLGVAGRKKFALATKAEQHELQSAIEPFLGERLMFALDAKKVLFLTEKMSPEDWASLLRAESDGIRKKILEQHKKNFDLHKAKVKRSYMPLKLKAAELKILAMNSKSSAAELEKALTPFLGADMMFIRKKPTTAKGKETLYLANKLPPETFILEAIQNHAKPFALKKIAAEVPVSHTEFWMVLNRMLEASQLFVRIDGKFNIAEVKATNLLAGVADTPAPLDDIATFRKTFDKLDCGRIYVRICNMRRELDWSEERFNTLLCKLRADGTIQLHAGDSATMTKEDVRLSYTDDNNFFYATLTWRKR